MDQLKELNERREQLEMLIQWKDGLSNLKEESISRLAEYWAKHVPGYSLTESGKHDLKKLINRFELQEIIDAIPIAADQYLKHDKQGKLEQASVNLAFSKIEGICRTRRLEKRKPYIRDLYYVRAVLRNRGYVNEQYIMELLESAVKAGIDVEELKNCAKTSSSWSRFRDTVESWIEKAWGG